MIIESSEVPDEVLDALIEAAPYTGSIDEPVPRGDWRQALAAALTVWENTARNLTPLVAGNHECTWRSVAVQNRDMIMGVKQTDVLQRCDGCGEVRALTLNGKWTLEQVR